MAEDRQECARNRALSAPVEYSHYPRFQVVLSVRWGHVATSQLSRASVGSCYPGRLWLVRASCSSIVGTLFTFRDYGLGVGYNRVEAEVPYHKKVSINHRQVSARITDCQAVVLRF